MSAWSTLWVPDYGFSFRKNFRTLITELGSGAEQRRSKGALPAEWDLTFSNRAESAIFGIQALHNTCAGAYGTFTFPNFAQMVKGSRLACVNSNPDTLTDSSSEFVTKAFSAAYDITIAGSGAGNDGVKGVASVAAGTLTLDAGESLAAESGNASLAVYQTYTVRFRDDNIELRPVAIGASGVIWGVTVRLIEVF